jgi:pimeloyl-ACP methyl ester carboxylesterase
MLTPPPPTFGDISLPNTTLHYVKCGSGPPLVMVPATVSLISQWLPLAQFMGQRFTAYFFELPGHGNSSPYPVSFDSRLLPDTVKAFMNALGHQTFNLMGFSFGGLLALRTLEALQERIEKVILISPCVSKRALLYSSPRQWGFRLTCSALKSPMMQQGAVRILQSELIERPLIYALSKASKIDRAILESKDALKIPQTSLDVLAYTASEIFNLDYRYADRPFPHSCFFAMSLYDDLLDYNITLDIVRDHFDDLKVQTLTLPYHQPPEPPTFDWLNQKFGRFLDFLL